MKHETSRALANNRRIAIEALNLSRSPATRAAGRVVCRGEADRIHRRSVRRRSHAGAGAIGPGWERKAIIPPLIHFAILVFFAAVCVRAQSATTAAAAPGSGQAGWKQIDQLVPPAIYSPSVERHRFGVYGPDAVKNPAFYPVPQDPVTRDTYLRWMGVALFSPIASPASSGSAACSDVLVRQHTATTARGISEFTLGVIPSTLIVLR